MQLLHALLSLLLYSTMHELNIHLLLILYTKYIMHIFNLSNVLYIVDELNITCNLRYNTYNTILLSN